MHIFLSPLTDYDETPGRQICESFGLSITRLPVW